MRTEAEAEAHIRLKVQEDMGFRNELIRNPRDVILAETGLALSDRKMEIISLEISKGMLGLGNIDRPLTEKELEQISGGWSSWEQYRREVWIEPYQ